MLSPAIQVRVRNRALQLALQRLVTAARYAVVAENVAAPDAILLTTNADASPDDCAAAACQVRGVLVLLSIGSEDLAARYRKAGAVCALMGVSGETLLHTLGEFAGRAGMQER
jgi:hypothetical protein